MPQEFVCPHCGKPVTASQSHCPNCGTALGSVWPPAPRRDEPLRPALPRPLTGQVWTDFLLGVAVQYLVHLVTARVLVRVLPWPGPVSLHASLEPGQTFALVGGEIVWAFGLGLVMYFALRRFFPAVARGSGYATLALLAVLLGALFTCQPVTY